jgi:hypothetical protein
MRNVKKVLVGFAALIVVIVGLQLVVQTIHNQQNKIASKDASNHMEALLAYTDSAEVKTKALALLNSQNSPSRLQATSSYADDDCVAQKQVCTYIVPRANPTWWEKIKVAVLGRTHFTCDGAETTCQWKVVASRLDETNSFNSLNWRWKKSLCEKADYIVEKCAGQNIASFSSLRLEGVDGSMSDLHYGDRFAMTTGIVGGITESSPMVDVEIRSSNDGFFKKLFHTATLYKNWGTLDQNGAAKNYHFAGKEFKAGSYTITGVKDHNSAQFQAVNLAFVVKSDGNGTESQISASSNIDNQSFNNWIHTAEAMKEAPLDVPDIAPSPDPYPNSSNSTSPPDPAASNSQGANTAPPASQAPYPDIITPRGASVADNVNVIESLPADVPEPNPLIALPTVTLTGPDTAVNGGSVAIHWANSAALSCTATGAWSGQWDNVAALSGNSVVTINNPDPSHAVVLTFSYNCSNSAGSSYDSFYVNVPAVPVPSAQDSPVPTDTSAITAQGFRIMYSSPLNEYQKLYSDYLRTLISFVQTNHLATNDRSDSNLIKTAQAQTVPKCGNTKVTYVGDGVFVTDDDELMDDIAPGLNGVTLPGSLIHQAVSGSTPFANFLIDCGFLDSSGNLSQSIIDSGFSLCRPDACAHEYVHLSFELSQAFQTFSSNLWDMLTTDQSQSLMSALISAGYSDEIAQVDHAVNTEYMAFLFQSTDKSLDEVRSFFAGDQQVYSDQYMTTYYTNFGLVTFDNTSSRIIIALRDSNGNLSNVSLLSFDASIGYINDFYGTQSTDPQHPIPTISSGGGIVTISIGPESVAYVRTDNDNVQLLSVIRDQNVLLVTLPTCTNNNTAESLNCGGTVMVSDGWMAWQDASGHVMAMFPPTNTIPGVPPGGIIHDPNFTYENGQVTLHGTLGDGSILVAHQGASSVMYISHDFTTGSIVWQIGNLIVNDQGVIDTADGWGGNNPFDAGKGGCGFNAPGCEYVGNYEPGNSPWESQSYQEFNDTSPAAMDARFGSY